MDNATIFIEKYKELEAVVRSCYKIRESDSISYYLRNKEQFKKFTDEIAYCQRLRNFMQHESKLNDKFSVVPSDDVIEFISALIERIRNKPRCMDACTKMKNIYWCGYSSKVLIAINEMRKRGIKKVPILENKRVVGVFDENSLFRYVADHGIVDINEGLTFEDIKEYLALDGRETEAFIFVKSSLYVEEVEDLFERKISQKKRVLAAFVTNTGRADEPLQGIITPWDIILHNDY